MRLRAGRWLAALALIVAASSHAALRLELNDEGLSSAQRQASQQLLDEALRTLPDSFVERLDRRVEVQWRDDLPSNGMGRALRPGAIALNTRYLAALTDGSAATQQTGRAHGTLRRELLATLLHELTHLYDRARLWDADEARVIRRCTMRDKSLGRVGAPDECRGQTGRRFTLSDDPRLLDLAGWPQYAGRHGEREQHNRFILRSPDSYELSNPREYAAVNMEYFLLDPSYACRRPSLYRYYASRFGERTQREQCASSYAYLNAGRDFGRQPLGYLDPERVYEVDYLIAEANNDIASRWGHTMLRLVVCAPGRPRGPDCRLDLDQHLVLSFRAFVGDLQLSSWDGLTGVYPSRLFVLPLSQVIEEYTKVELRSLASIPLKLSREEVNSLVERSAQTHWSYDGNYYFLSNNCAVETLKLLRGGIPRQSLQNMDSITPYGVLGLLENQRIADASVLENPKEALRLGYRFDSFRDRYQAMFDVLKKRLDIRQEKVEDWLALPAVERRPWFDKADLRASAALLLLEQASLRRQLLLAQDELKQLYLSNRDDLGNNSRLATAGKTLQQILDDSGFLSRPAELLDGGYGLPQAKETVTLEQQTQQRQKHLRQLSDNLDREVRALLTPERRDELAALEANTRQISAHLRELHKAAGGFELP
ncbi:DUF4105 domain-containing protein [Pseudomonas sp. ZM23]|uniref:DUF4105 domain-containing protein n=1 Tax=Pseudomonas triclosanedens TaxID=2961893 RepID=A0ABY7A0F0_9PSED|nr:DUF4105 domain-containing protein [Pseudomonas triclosanedens]MCP8462564.1 DUF4105 domain-containing protein [Pseudomonas triclosanedens]MCP8468202.1 DUF4105 domain-containing protein [Pseudomonas triclosanedens]MCP8474961.1 DUF4105 domain-containing protein [Pseudomonas triclosanedens]WAI49755.1 DUF4105 domain-containing protein [Pseudomonas triclosanedens]